MFLSKKFRSVGFLTLMFCAFSFVACSGSDDEEEEMFEITKDGMEYKIKSVTGMEIESPDGEVKIEKSDSKYKVSLKELGAKGVNIMGASSLSFDFDVTLKDIKKGESYEIKFDKKSDIKKSIPFAFTITITDAAKTALGLPSNAANSIEIEDKSKMAELTFSIEEPTTDAKKVEYGSKKYAGFLTKDKLEVGVKMVSSFKITLTNEELIASVKDNPTKALLEKIMTYTPSSSVTDVQKAMRTSLVGVLDAQRSLLSTGGIGETVELVLKFEKK